MTPRLTGTETKILIKICLKKNQFTNKDKKSALWPRKVHQSLADSCSKMLGRPQNWCSKMLADKILGRGDTIDEGEGAFLLPMAGHQLHLLVISLPAQATAAHSG